jgi:hypothetical protein
MRRPTDNPNVSRQQDPVPNSRTIEEKELDGIVGEAVERAGKEEQCYDEEHSILQNGDDFGLEVDFRRRPLFGGALKHPQTLM